MNNSINQIGDEAAKALIAAGKNSVTVMERFIPLGREGDEPNVYAINENGTIGIDAVASTALRYGMSTPQVIREQLKLERPADVIEHVLRFKMPGTVVFARKPIVGVAGACHAVIDYSADREHRGWNRQHAVAPIALSEDIVKWHDKIHGQADFAALIDDYVEDVVSGEPTGDQLLEMANSLEVTDINVTGYKRNPKTRLFDVTLTGKTETTTVVYPRFTIKMPVFADRPDTTVEIRLSLVKVGSGYGFETRVHRFDKLVQSEFAALCKDLADKTGVAVWQGHAPEVMKCT